MYKAITCVSEENHLKGTQGIIPRHYTQSWEEFIFPPPRMENLFNHGLSIEYPEDIGSTVGQKLP